MWQFIWSVVDAVLYMLGKCLFERSKYRDAQAPLKDALARQREIEPGSFAMARSKDRLIALYICIIVIQSYIHYL